MFIKNPHGSETIQGMAKSLGVVFGETCGTGPAMAGFTNAYSIKDQLQEQGARWNRENKAWVFDGWDDARNALTKIMRSNEHE